VRVRYAEVIRESLGTRCNREYDVAAAGGRGNARRQIAQTADGEASGQIDLNGVRLGTVLEVAEIRGDVHRAGFTLLERRVGIGPVVDRDGHRRLIGDRIDMHVEVGAVRRGQRRIGAVGRRDNGVEKTEVLV